MRYNGESAEEWYQKVTDSETIRAKAMLSAGHNAEDVLEEFSKRIADKMLYPVIKMVRTTNRVFDAVENRRKYAEGMKNTGLKPDYVS